MVRSVGSLLLAVAPVAKQQADVAAVDDAVSIEIGASRLKPVTKHEREVGAAHAAVEVQIRRAVVIARAGAEVQGGVDAGLVPAILAAGGPDLAHQRAADGVVAEGALLRETAVAGILRPASLAALAAAEEEGGLDAGGVPADLAAEDPPLQPHSCGRPSGGDCAFPQPPGTWVLLHAPARSSDCDVAGLHRPRA